MATQTVEFTASAGLTLTAKLFSAGSDTEVASASATEATNRKGTYTVPYTDVPVGTYKLIGLSGSTPVVTYWVELVVVTATYVAYDSPPNVMADALLKRNMSNVQATADEHTLASVILGQLEWSISGSTLTIYRTDGTTVHYTKTLSSGASGGNVITGLA